MVVMKMVTPITIMMNITILINNDYDSNNVNEMNKNNQATSEENDRPADYFLSC